MIQGEIQCKRDMKRFSIYTQKKWDKKVRMDGFRDHLKKYQQTIQLLLLLVYRITRFSCKDRSLILLKFITLMCDNCYIQMIFRILIPNKSQRRE